MRIENQGVNTIMKMRKYNLLLLDYFMYQGMILKKTICASHDITHRHHLSKKNKSKSRYKSRIKKKQLQPYELMLVENRLVEARLC